MEQEILFKKMFSRKMVDFHENWPFGYFFLLFC